MEINPKIFKAYDIRGIYPEEINEENFENIVRAIYTFFSKSLHKKNFSAVLGRDMRISSPALFEVAKKTLVASGATVIDIGLSATPTFYYAVIKGQYDVGIDITASHNPKEYAGVKFVKRDGDKILKIGKSTGMDEISRLTLAGNFPEYTHDGKVVKYKNALDDEVSDALSSFDVSKLKSFKIACDPANGMGSLYVKELFKRIPGELVEMNFELDGTFPAHQADPLDFNNLIPLQEKVKEIKADLGIEPDGDGDRIFFIDDRAEVIPATSISSLIAKEVLEEEPQSKIIVDIRYTRNVRRIVEKYGGSLFVSKVGHAFITEDVNREGSPFAGESSGHFYFGQTGGAESSVRVILYVLMEMSITGKPISQILQGLRSSYESGEFNFILPGGVRSDELLQEIAQEHKDGKTSSLDGIAIDYPNWRFSIRSSNTEPLLRLNVESDAPKKTEEKLKLLTDRILSTGAKPKTSNH